ncbi:MAG: DUF4249 family protein [Bacteroidales bacterium]|nr:DUF4249 family protein [Bacteroidales bacterium]
MKFFSILALASAALTACSIDFEIESPDTPKLLLFAFVGESCRSEAKVSCALPVFMEEKADLKDVSLKLTRIPNSSIEVEVERIGESHWILPGNLSRGEKLRVEVESPKYGMATAETTIPMPIDTCSFDIGLDSLQNCYRLKINDLPSGNLGICLSERLIVKDTVLLFPCLNDVREIVAPSSGSTGKTKTVNGLTIWVNRNVESAIEVCVGSAFSGGFRDVLKREVRLSVCSLSEEMYCYLSAQYSIAENKFAAYGLAAPSFSYTNVVGGTGIFAAYSQWNSRWVAFDY